MEEVRFLTAGDAAIVVEFGKTINEAVNRKVRALEGALVRQPVEGVVDLVPSIRSLLVCFDAAKISRGKLAGILSERCKKLSAETPEDRIIIEIPVCYSARFGADLQAVAAQAGISCDEVAALHSGQDHRVYMFGGMPGFPCMGGMEEKLILKKPKETYAPIPSGAVCIQGEQTGIYPLEAPGDWWVIGATPVQIYDRNRERPFLCETGEFLRLIPVSPFEYYDIRRMVELGEYKCRVTKNGAECDGRDAAAAQERPVVADMGAYAADTPERAAGAPSSGVQGDFSEKGVSGKEEKGRKQKHSPHGKSSRKPKKAAGKPAVSNPGKLEILTPGLLTSVQDYGRVGYQKYGISVSGAMDRASYAYANALVGNPAGAAVLECTLLGPSFTVLEDMVIALTGADMQPTKNGQPMPMNETVRLKRGDEVVLGMAKSGCRAYLAVSGGIDVPQVMGSRSTHLKSGTGGYRGRKLLAGDVLVAGRAGEVWDEKPQDAKLQNKKGWDEKSLCDLREASLSAVGAAAQDVVELSVIQGPQKEYFTASGEQVFFSEVYRLTKNCDRTGYQLDGVRIMTVSGVAIVPDGIALGAVQISSAGRPIIMLADRPTVGGYAKFGTVAEADIPKLAQLRPGAAVRFVKYEV